MDISEESVCKIITLMEACIKVLLLLDSYNCIIVAYNELHWELDFFLMKSMSRVEVDLFQHGIIVTRVMVVVTRVIIISRYEHSIVKPCFVHFIYTLLHETFMRLSFKKLKSLENFRYLWQNFRATL